MKYLIVLLFVGLGTLTYAQKQQKQAPSEVASTKKAVKKVSHGDQLYLLSVDNKTQEISKAEFDKIDKDQIEYVKVLKDAGLISMYGEKGKNGVVLVVMKNNTAIKKKQRQG
jgi:hypothetical protein